MSHPKFFHENGIDDLFPSGKLIITLLRVAGLRVGSPVTRNLQQKSSAVLLIIRQIGVNSKIRDDSCLALGGVAGFRVEMLRIRYFPVY